MDEFTLTSRIDQGCIVISLEGDLDLHAARLRRDDLLLACSVPNARTVLDLSELRFCDSAGVRLLLEAQGRATRSAGVLVLADPASAVLKLLRIAGLDHAFTILSTVAEAVAIPAA